MSYIHQKQLLPTHTGTVVTYAAHVSRHMQGETAQEMAGLAEAMQTKAVPVHTSCDGDFLHHRSYATHPWRVAFQALAMCILLMPPCRSAADVLESTWLQVFACANLLESTDTPGTGSQCIASAAVTSTC